jgi:pyruvate formate lyase activating enzyme
MSKGLIFDIRRYSVHDGPGIRTTVFFKGCPLQCTWCHNPESWLEEPQAIVRSRQLNGQVRQVTEIVGRWMGSDEIMEVLLKDRVFYEESQGGVTFSGGEPLLQADFLIDLLEGCKKAGIHTALDTSGYAEKDTFLAVAANTQLLLFDIKVFDKHLHQTYTGVDNRQIIQNLLALPAGGPKVIIRIPVIPGVNNNMQQMKDIRDLLKKTRAPVLRVELLPYHRLGRHKYEALHMPVPAAFKEEASAYQYSEYRKLFTNASYQTKTSG